MHFTSKINPVFFIAEVGSNHEGSFLEAKKLVINACNSKADAVKLQIFSADNLVSIKYDKKRYDHFKRLELSIEQNKKLCQIIKSKKKLCSASIWDVDQIKIFRKYIDIYKIGSGDVHNFELIKKIILTNKPLVVSTGLCNLYEIEQICSFINKTNSNFIRSGKLAILHCNTAYPTPKEDSYLGTIDYLKSHFKICTGFSDHTIGDEIITHAYVLGAKIIEKHFSNTIKKKSFRDHEISLNKKGVDRFLIRINKIKNYLRVKHKLTGSEKNQKNLRSFRRSIYAKRDIQNGETFSSKNLISLRPFLKLSSNMYFKLIKKKSQKFFKKGDVIN